jgi:hypothetical protein
MAATPMQYEPRLAAEHLELPEDLSRRFGGLVILEYLMNLFGESPKEVFSRIDVLAVLDGVKSDSALFPEAVVEMSERIKAPERTRRPSSPKRLGGSARRRSALN